jgi:hypothetical protein
MKRSPSGTPCARRESQARSFHLLPHTSQTAAQDWAHSAPEGSAQAPGAARPAASAAAAAAAASAGGAARRVSMAARRSASAGGTPEPGGAAASNASKAATSSARAALAGSWSTRSKVPKGSATDAGMPTLRASERVRAGRRGGA